MKKLFSLVLVVVLAATMVLGTAAADTQLLAGSNGTIDLSAAVEGDTLEIVGKYDGSKDADGIGAGWGVGGICLDGDWSNVASDFTCTLEATPVKDDVFTFTFDAFAIKNAATGDILVNLYNGFTPVTVTLKNAVVEDGGAGEDSSDDSAQTGDMMNVALLAGVAALAFVAVVASKKANA